MGSMRREPVGVQTAAAHAMANARARAREVFPQRPVPPCGVGIGPILRSFGISPASGWCFADLIANDRPGPLVEHFTLDRFRRGVNIDERGAGPDPKLHG